MNHFSDEDRQRINAEALELLSRPASRQESGEGDRREEQPVTPVDLPPLETRNEKHRRELAEQEARFAAERRRERREERLDTRTLTVADVETLIAAALCEERSVVIPVIRQALDEILDAEREHHKSELLERTRGLELAIAKLESALAQLQPTLATERSGKPLPPNLLSVN